MVPAPYRNALVVQELREVVRVHVRQGEGDEPGPVSLRAVQGYAFDLREPAVRVLPEMSLVVSHVLHAQPVEVVHGGTESYGLRDVHSAGLELVGQVVPGGVVQVDLPDHLSSSEERVHILQYLRLTPQNPDAGGPEHLVPAARIEITP